MSQLVGGLAGNASILFHNLGVLSGSDAVAQESNIGLTTVLGVLICLIMLALVVYVVFTGRRRNLQLAQEEQERGKRLQEEIDAIRVASEQSAKRTQEEMQGNLRGVSDSMVRLMGEVTRTQQSQLDSFGGQLRAVSRVEEERLEKMTQMVERQLSNYDQRMQAITQVLDDKLEANEQRMERMRQSLDDGLNRLRDENGKRLDEMRLTVDEKLHSTLDRRLGESFQMVSEQLEKVTRGLGEMQTLATGVGDLKRVLTNVKTRGTWGEVQLGTLLEQILAPGQYGSNVQVSPQRLERVEFAVILPGKQDDQQPVYLPMDAKCPIEDYQRLLTASEQADPAGVEAAGKAMADALRKQAKAISEKYIEPPFTTDYAIMFLPIEGLYAEALRSGTLVEELQRDYRVVVTGPTTLAALLNSLQMGFRTLAIEQRTSEVWGLLSAVKTEFSRFSELLSRTQRKLRQASDSIDDAARKTRTIERRLRGVTEGEAEALSEAQETEPAALQPPMSETEGEPEEEAGLLFIDMEEDDEDDDYFEMDFVAPQLRKARGDGPLPTGEGQGPEGGRAAPRRGRRARSGLITCGLLALYDLTHRRGHKEDHEEESF